MMKFLPAAALIATLSVSGTASAADETPARSFTRDGVTYVYTSTAMADGRVVLDGKVRESGSPFTLTIRGDRVTGRAGNTPVSFRVKRGPVVAPTVIAAR